MDDRLHKELFRIVSSIHSLSSLDELTGMILDSAMDLTDAEAGSVILENKKDGCLEFYAAKGGASAAELSRIKVPAESIAGSVFSSGTPLLLADVKDDSRFFSEVDQKTHFKTRSIICVPMIINRTCIGVMELLNGSRSFTEEDLEVFSAFASQAAVAITNTRLYEEILTEKNRTGHVFDNLPLGLILVSSEGEIISVNRFMKKFCHKLPEGKNIFRLKSEIFKILAAMLKEENTAEKQIRMKLGEEMLDLHLRICRLHSYRWKGNALIVENVTQLLRAREIAAWQDVARKLAHELKNPLTPIQLAAQYLEYLHGQQDGNFEAELKKHIAIINSQVEKLKKMLTEFSSFARLPLPKLQFSDLGAVLESIKSLYQKTYPEISFTFSFSAIPKFMFDSSQIEQILINLIKNSIEALQETETSDKKIILEAFFSEKNRIVTVAIENNGPEIPEEIRANLFKPYFTTKKTGTGLGLAIAQRIINDHGGSINVRNLNTGGVRFQIELPIRES